jgi:hypothetical protein
VFTCALGVACDEKLSSVTGPTPNLNPSFSSINANIFQTTDSSGRSACVTCHGGARPASGLDLSGNAYAALVNVPSREKPGQMLVEPGDADSSYLYQKLEGTTGIVGLRMPRNGPPYLTDGQIQVIERWIEEGAKNN